MITHDFSFFFVQVHIARMTAARYITYIITVLIWIAALVTGIIAITESIPKEESELYAVCEIKDPSRCIDREEWSNWDVVCERRPGCCTQRGRYGFTNRACVPCFRHVCVYQKDGEEINPHAIDENGNDIYDRLYETTYKEGDPVTFGIVSGALAGAGILGALALYFTGGVSELD